ncbi:M14 family metallopeptidase [Flavobacterium sp.]|uniref:M14 family metallopeptidase n=1 Tax=Flavobacterium sp. TaxID=239 RepID=UPI00286E4AA2|nr:M14 family metallopeptidase [Flavobacterium sp.]
MDFNTFYTQIKQQNLFGRYITNNHIKPVLDSLSNQFQVSSLGFSVLEKPIYSVQFGNGETKILMWSQMHGNESTTTKALFDLFDFLESNAEEAILIKKKFTLLCIPILNPDGAEVYTRENANEVDLNRDALDLSQPESKLLKQIYLDFKPDYCYNLHDQRTIYAAGNTNNPATLSFLAPAFNAERAVNANRQKAIGVIVAINKELQKHIPNQVGRFDDTFNPNCVGDTFQSLGTSTILFEAGHFQNDYQREETRKFMFIAILTGILNSYENDIVLTGINDYLIIPQNKVLFNDILYRKIKINSNNLNIITNFAAQYEEVLKDNEIIFEAIITEVGEDIRGFGHIEYNGEEGIYSDNSNNKPEINKKVNFYLNKSIKFVNGLSKM